MKNIKEVKMVKIISEAIDLNVAEDLPEGATPKKTKKLKHQSASAVGIYVKSDYENIIPSNYFCYRGEDVVEVFCNWLVTIEKDYAHVLKTNIALNLTPEEEQIFETAEHFYYCKQNLGIDRVRDHDHFNGKFRGASHNL
jgi:hypothetical protein